MASIISLKRRIGSIKNIRQITKAMELVSASKLRRAQDYAKRSRDYHDLANELLARLSTIRDVESHPLFEKRAIKNSLYVVVTSNSGLAGAYNANTLKQLMQSIKVDQNSKINSQVIAIGTKGAQFVRRLQGVELMAVYPAFGDQPTANDVRPVLNSVLEHFKDKDVDKVSIIYTQSRSSISQFVQSFQLLPVTANNADSVATVPAIATFEPDIETVIQQVGTRLIEAQIWQAVLEGLASEHAMRMVAMKNSTDNANDLIDDYTLEYNTARQAHITQELAEITGGAEAMKD